MKKYLLFLLFCIMLIQTAFCQYDQKYLHYRERFRKYFTVIGNGQGESNVLVIRNGKARGDKTVGASEIKVPNQVMNLGDYIAMLAMEYKILSEAGQSVNQTAKELYYALYAFNRLDYVAETHFGMTAELNGFFIRDDVYSGTDFISGNPQLNNGLTAPCLTCNPPQYYIDYITGSGEVQWVGHIQTNPEYTWNSNFQFPDDCGLIDDGGIDKQKDFRKRDLPSPDEIVGLFFGMAMVAKCVPPTANYNGLAMNDRYGYVNFADAAREITDRVITWMRDNGWDIKSPTGCTLFSGPEWLKYGYAIAAGEIWDDHDKYRESMSGIGWCSSTIWSDVFDGSGQEVNTKITSMLAAIGNSWNCLGGTFDTYNRIVDNSSNYNNWKYFYPLIYTVLHGGSNSISQSEVETLLASAPDNGPFNHNTADNSNDFASNGWCTDFLFRMHNEEQQCVDENGNATRDPGNYHGLDFMLLHNMYMLLWKIPSDPDCDAVPDLLITALGPAPSNSNYFPNTTIAAKEEIITTGAVIPLLGQTWRAGTSITLNPGFETVGPWTGEIGGCIDLNSRLAAFDSTAENTNHKGGSTDTISQQLLYASMQTDKSENKEANSVTTGATAEKETQNIALSNSPSPLFISPNPSADGKFNLNCNIPEVGCMNAEIKVMNALGQTIQTSAFNNYVFPVSLNLSSQPKGTYFVKIFIADRVFVEKVVSN